MSDAKKPAAVAAPKSPVVTLASGHKMPLFALGTWKSPPGVTKAAVVAAIRAGYRNIDAANDYNNEDEVGAAIRECIDQGIVTRDDLFIQAKLWNSNHRPEHIMGDLNQTLKDLQLDYLDSWVIHWPQAVPSSGKFTSTRLTGANTGPWKENPMFPTDEEGYFSTDKDSHYIETWKFMEGLVDKGLVKSIGISNFNATQVKEVVAVARIPVSVLQCECHPYLHQKDLIELCNFHNIKFQAFSPLGSGETHLGVSAPPTGTIPLKDPTIAKLASKYDKNPGQFMLKWAIQRNISVVSKSVSPARITSNIDIFDFTISDEDMTAMNALNCGWRHLLWFEASDHPDYPFKSEIPYGYVLEKAPLITSSGN